MLAELIAKAEAATKNLEYGKRTPVNMELAELGLTMSMSLGLESHTEFYRSEIDRRRFEAYEFPEVTLDECVTNLTGHRAFVWKVDAWYGHFLSYNVRRWGKTIAKVGPLAMLKSHVPPSILAAMVKIDKLGLRMRFCAVGLPDAFRIPKADPIILAYPWRGSPSVAVRDQPTHFYFIGKYN